MFNKKSILDEIIQNVKAIKENNPMAGSITNSVTINFVANAQLAVGGAAAMVYLPDEAEFIAKVGKATYINLGTLLPIYDETLSHVGKVLYENNKQWVLDPVAIGIGSLRSKILKEYKKYKPTIIKGNASEIIALAGLWGLEGGVGTSNVRGVDSTDAVNDAKDAAISIARFTNGAVVVTGVTDLVTDGKLLAYSYGGSHFMEKITGAGCSLGGVLAVYATYADPFIASLTGVSVYNLAACIAEKKANGPGSFYVQFIDELYKLTGEEIANNKFDLIKL